MTLSEERLRDLLAAETMMALSIPELRAILAELLSLRSDAHTSGEVTEYDPDAPPDHSADNAADFIFKHLSDALGVDGKWSVSDGTETWDGDVAGTLYNILIAAGIWDNENGQLAGPIAWLVGWDENPYGMFARTETEANHVIANLNAYAKGVRTNLRAKPLFASPALSLGHPIQGEAVAWVSEQQLAGLRQGGQVATLWSNAPAQDYVPLFDSPQPPTPAGVREITEEPYWLIERKGFDGKPYPHWYAENETGWHWWTPIAVDAKPFPSKAEAAAFPSYRMIATDPNITLTEHVTMGDGE